MKKHSLTKQKEVREDKPNHASFGHGSTVQGGSNYGQGSSGLPNHANRQGSESGQGSNYGNEKGWNNESLRQKEETSRRAPDNLPFGKKS